LLELFKHADVELQQLALNCLYDARGNASVIAQAIRSLLELIFVTEHRGVAISAGIVLLESPCRFGEIIVKHVTQVTLRSGVDTFLHTAEELLKLAELGSFPWPFESTILSSVPGKIVAMLAASRFGEGAGNVICPFLSDKDAVVREFAVHCFAYLNHPSAIMWLEKVLTDQDDRVRSSTIYALYQLRPLPILTYKLLGDRLLDSVNTVRYAAEKMLRLLSYESSSWPADES
jgi:hypothetical protein